jgi:hypothetical protein
MAMKPSARPWAARAAALSVLLCAAPAGADQDRAEVLFREGHAAMKAGDLTTACARFDESRRLDTNAIGPLINFADCEAHSGRIATALALWRQGHARMNVDDERLPHATARIADLSARVPTLTLRLDAAAPAGSEVRLDGAPAGVGQRLELDPGDHAVEGRAAGRAPFGVVVHLAEREHREVVVTFAPPQGDTSVPPPPPASADAGRGRRIAGVVVGSVGLAALAFAGVTGAMALSRQSTVDDECDDAKRCTQRGLDAGEEGRTLVTLNTVGFVVGGAALATGIVLIVTAPSGRPASAATRVSFGAGPGALGVRAATRF